MKNLIILFLLTLLYGCTKNPDRIEEVSANNGESYVKNYFKNNSKVRIQVYNKNDNKLLIEKEIDKKNTTKFIEYYKNGGKKLVATLITKPNFFGIKNYYENGKKESEGSILYDNKTNNLVPVSDWVFYNKQSGNIDSIGHFFSDGNISILDQVHRIDNKNKKITKIKYFEIKPKDTTNNSVNWEVKRIR